MVTDSSQLESFRSKAGRLVAEMTLEEKASLCSGRDFWTTKAIERLGVPSIFLADGPHGLRKAVGHDVSDSVPATCFPTASALACSWNVELAREVGAAIGREAQCHDVQVLLGPAVNMKRSPLCGRNFEYYSEDPQLAGELAAAFVHGVQSEGVGTSLKHFAANNQEFERMTTSSNLDERTLHEIYLRAFEIAVRDAQPWTVMCAYNRVNGTFASEHPLLLDETLKRRWGFQGFVVSDWGAVNDRVAGIRAGLHLEMPSSLGKTDAQIVEAVTRGELEEARLDQLVTELLAVILRAKALARPAATVDVDAHHALGRRVAGESIVLLKNEGSLLPIDPARVKRLALIGQFAETPRYQGAGSSQVRPTRLTNAASALREALDDAVSITFASGYDSEGATDDSRVAEAERLARQSDLAIVFAGLPDSCESEAFDRSSLELPQGHNRLIEAVCAVQPNVVVVLMNGSAVTLPWASRVPAIVEAWLGGQASGEAIADVLTGTVNPSGKLAETFPARLEDTPAHLDFPGRDGESRYGERLFIGYRGYEKRRLAPLYAFGHGLSYTTFQYSDWVVSTPATMESDTILVQAQVTLQNTGRRAGKEIVQLYVREPASRVSRPEKELKRFLKVELSAGERRTLRFELGFRDFAYYDSSVHDWVVDPGRFEILVGGSSEHPALSAAVTLRAARTLYAPLTRDSMLKEFAEHPRGRPLYSVIEKELVALFGGQGGDASPEAEAARRKARAMAVALVRELPIWKLPSMSQGHFSEQQLAELLSMLE